MIDPLFQVTYKCMLCEQEFQSSRVRPSFKKPYKRDADFCLHYHETNPEYYVVRVCKYCGFSTTENFSPKIKDSQRREFMVKIGDSWQGRDYGGERTWQEALETYKLALLCAQIKEESSRIIAGILHHIAWMYRYKEDQEMEERFLRYTLDEYEAVFESGEDELNAAKLMFIMGELNRRLKNYHEAVRWFSRVVNDKKIMDANMIRACREQWAAVKEEMVEAENEAKENDSASSL